MTTAIDIIDRLAPKAHANYRAAFQDPAGLLREYGINNDLRLAHFMSQCFHETGNLTLLIENGKYNEKNLGDMWDSNNWRKYFSSRDEMVAMAAQCKIDRGEALFNRVYARKTLGNVNPGDGWKYRGRGIMQTTGRYHYRKYSRKFGVPFEDQPDLIASADHALKPALAEWVDGNLNAAADHNDIRLITQTINGGLKGLAERQAKFAKVWALVSRGSTIETTNEYKVQKALNAAGFNCGKADGVVGERTRQAILRYCARYGLPPIPHITRELINSLQV